MLAKWPRAPPLSQLENLVTLWDTVVYLFAMDSIPRRVGLISGIKSLPTLQANVYTGGSSHVSAKYVIAQSITLFQLWPLVLYCKYGLCLVFDNLYNNPLHYRTPHPTLLITLYAAYPLLGRGKGGNRRKKLYRTKQ